MSELHLKSQQTHQIPILISLSTKCQSISARSPQSIKKSSYLNSLHAEAKEMVTQNKKQYLLNLQDTKSTLKQKGLSNTPVNVKKELESNEYELPKIKNILIKEKKSTSNSLLQFSQQQVRDQILKREENQNCIIKQKLILSENKSQLIKDNEIPFSGRNNIRKYITTEAEKSPNFHLPSQLLYSSKFTAKINNQLFSQRDREDTPRMAIQTVSSETLKYQNLKVPSISISQNANELEGSSHKIKIQVPKLLKKNISLDGNIIYPLTQRDKLSQSKDRQQSTQKKLKVTLSPLKEIMNYDKRFQKFNKFQDNGNKSQIHQSIFTKQNNNDYNNSFDDNLNEFLIVQDTPSSNLDKINSQSTLDSTPILKSKSQKMITNKKFQSKIYDERNQEMKELQRIKQRELPNQCKNQNSDEDLSCAQNYGENQNQKNRNHENYLFEHLIQYQNQLYSSSQLLQIDQNGVETKMILNQGENEFNYKTEIWDNILKKRIEKQAAQQPNSPKQANYSMHQRLPTFSACSSSLTQCKVEPVNDFVNVFQQSLSTPFTIDQQQQEKDVISSQPSCFQINSKETQIQNVINNNQSNCKPFRQINNNHNEQSQQQINTATYPQQQKQQMKEDILRSPKVKVDFDKLKEAYTFSFRNFLPVSI